MTCRTYSVGDNGIDRPPALYSIMADGNVAVPAHKRWGRSARSPIRAQTAEHHCKGAGGGE